MKKRAAILNSFSRRLIWISDLSDKGKIRIAKRRDIKLTLTKNKPIIMVIKRVYITTESQLRQQSTNISFTSQLLQKVNEALYLH